MGTTAYDGPAGEPVLATELTLFADGCEASLADLFDITGLSPRERAAVTIGLHYALVQEAAGAEAAWQRARRLDPQLPTAARFMLDGMGWLVRRALHAAGKGRELELHDALAGIMAAGSAHIDSTGRFDP
ncbi:MAG TPA: hypothetical protein VD926_00860 [Acidimicrobiales bacterium]|nr:hypothetical protein [Acidimicrobiales bacterium]